MWMPFAEYCHRPSLVTRDASLELAMTQRQPDNSGKEGLG